MKNEKQQQNFLSAKNFALIRDSKNTKAFYKSIGEYYKLKQIQTIAENKKKSETNCDE